jgi:hypothetical protein
VGAGLDGNGSAFGKVATKPKRPFIVLAARLLKQLSNADETKLLC